jgi:hypothetical protein
VTETPEWCDACEAWGNVHAPEKHRGEGTVKIEPHWGNTLLWMAANMAEHGFIRGSYSAMYSILDVAGYLARTDPHELERVLKLLEAKTDWDPKEEE